MSPSPSSNFRQLPATRLGWWAVRLAILFVVLLVVVMIVPQIGRNLRTEPFLPNPAPIVLLIGFVSGLLALLAILLKRERSWLVWLALFPGILGTLVLLGDLLRSY